MASLEFHVEKLSNALTNLEERFDKLEALVPEKNTGPQPAPD